MDFPQPFHLTDSATRWRLSDILAFESARTGTGSARLAPADESYLSAKAVGERLGVSASTIWRWAAESARVAA